jgi:osmotically inducible protein OsmC
MTTTTHQRVIYTAKTHTTGGREGESRSSDGRLAVKLSLPGTPGNGTNPEQLFAAGWSACFEGAMGGAARKMKVALPPDVAIDAEIDLRVTDGEYSLEARLNVSVPGLPRDVAQALVDAAERTCPYTKAIRGNVPFSITLV